jgi:hypothetical protein
VRGIGKAARSAAWRGAKRLPFADGCLYDLEQLASGDGLGEESADRKAALAYAGFEVGPAGENDDRKRLGFAGFPQHGQELDSAVFREPEVQHDGGRRRRVGRHDCGHGLRLVLGDADAIPAAFENVGHDRPNFAVVVHDQDEGSALIGSTSQSGLDAERALQLSWGDGLHFDQNVAEPLLGRSLSAKGLTQLLGRYDIPGKQKLPEQRA